MSVSLFLGRFLVSALLSFHALVTLSHCLPLYSGKLVHRPGTLSSRTGERDREGAVIRAPELLTGASV